MLCGMGQRTATSPAATVRPKPRRRSKRLEKKLHLGEFQEFGFAVSVRLKPDTSAKVTDEFWDRFIVEVVVARGLAFGGGADGFVTRFGKGSASEDDRAAVGAWLEGQPMVLRHTVGPLEDAWYGAEPAHAGTRPR